jgi:hypothetical protein
LTTHALELALHDLSCKRSAREQFAQDAPAFLGRYRLEEAEARAVRDFDVAALQRRGVSPLLTLGFWMTNEPGRSRAQYLERLRAQQGGG